MPATSTRDRLLQDAERLVRSRGYAGFSYADLAERVGIRKASIHHHFPTKDALGAALVDDYRTRFRHSLAAIADTEHDAPARLAAYGRIYVVSVAQGMACLCGVLAADLALLPEPLRQAVAAFFHDQLAWLETVVREGVARGELRAGGVPDRMASHVLGAFQGASFVALALGDVAQLEATIETLLHGLRP